MIEILTTSKDAARLAQVVRLIGDCGNYRTTRAVGSPSLLLERGDSLDAFDVLIVDALSLADAELPVITDLCHRHKRMTCILLMQDTSPETLIAAMRAGIRDVLGWPLDQRSLVDALQRAEGRSALQGTHETQVISFMSCKGGTGTSFVASNVAQAISGVHNKRVLLVDLNQLFGDAAFLITSDTPPSTLPQVCGQIERMDSAFLETSLLHVSDTFHVLASAGDPVKAAEIKEERLEWMLGVAIPRYDFVIFDLGQTINSLSILALDRSDEIHVVLQPSMPHVRAGRRLQEIFVSLGYPPDRMRLVLNRNNKHGQRARAALEEVLGMQPHQVLPDEPEIVADAMNEGVPVSAISRNSGVARGLQKLAESLVRGQSAAGRGRERGEAGLGRFFGLQRTPKLKTM